MSQQLRGVQALLSVALLLLAAPGCDRPADDDAVQLPPADTVAGPAPDTAPAADEADGGAVPFDAPVVVYMAAGRRAMERAGSAMDAEAFSVMADDLMFYRASAISVLERQPVRLVRIEGRRPLRFVVDGQARAYDFPDHTTLDLVVLYAPGREPRAVPPIELAADPDLAARYFQATTPGSG